MNVVFSDEAYKLANLVLKERDWQYGAAGEVAEREMNEAEMVEDCYQLVLLCEKRLARGD